MTKLVISYPLFCKDNKYPKIVVVKIHIKALYLDCFVISAYATEDSMIYEKWNDKVK